MPIARRIGDERLLIESLAGPCGGYFLVGQQEKGFPVGQESVERARQLGDDVMLAESLLMFLLASDLVDPAGSEPLFTEAIGCTERSGDQLIAFLLHNNAGSHALCAGDIPAARAHLEQALRAMRAIGEESHHVSVNLGWVLRQESDPDGARSMLKESLRIARRTGDRSGIGYSGLGLACLAADRGEWHLASMLHGVAQAFVDQAGEPWQEPEARYRQDSLGLLRAHLGDEQFDQASAQGMALDIDEALDLALGRSLRAQS